MSDTVQPQYAVDGFAIVEIMGHRRVVGAVETVYIGSAAFLKVTTPAVEPERVVVDARKYVAGEYLLPGDVVEFSRAAAQCLVAATSIYAVTPIPEEDLLKHAPMRCIVVERKPRMMFPDPLDQTPVEEASW